MKIISVEGLDKSGKATLARMLAEFLRSKRFKVAESQSPDYSTPTGEVIRQWLAKEYNVDQKTIEFVYTANMQEQQEKFKQLEEEYNYDFVIMDRYTGSQRAYATATGSDIEFVETLQKDMRQPDIMIYIDITPEESMKRKGKHNDGNNDRYEENVNLLNDVRSRYLVNNDVPKILVNGMQAPEHVFQDTIVTLIPIIKDWYHDMIKELTGKSIREVLENEA